MMLAAPLQVTGVDEMTRHAGDNVSCSVPVVVVASVYVPSGLAVQAPVTWRDPLTGAEGQPAPTNVRSRSPVTWRHDELTFQVPIRLPPQAVTLEQDPPCVPPPELPPAAPPVPLAALPPVPPAEELPPVPDSPPAPEPQAPEIIPAATPNAKTTDCTFIGGGSFEQVLARRPRGLSPKSTGAAERRAPRDPCRAARPRRRRPARRRDRCNRRRAGRRHRRTRPSRCPRLRPCRRRPRRPRAGASPARRRTGAG